ncbi:NAD(P)-dependent dehydrogenase (short-subunit alcohol dehydrogenase family) [Rhizomicrobium palustre]|uniref:NAD(P)-dependent dehydrogenase (Short-subunit alcohol dehydrogenase family) n=1 Tax=Rhizomicrobium palustre TaxID=189966 RepID=A0A846MVH9_9PROT|nr:SDR family NAD(P)-dependent oxidoreductase [Rhizomicrobium palustre]NIK87070.1 NAD(P)-dependent dehydrogenase (short-subunit alcohol dehydrogenase family) [Rhizomicrobium palustre]
MSAPRLVLITGASRGIGRAAAVALAGEGCHLVLVARSVGGLEETDDAVKAAGGSATLVPLDLRDGDGLDRLGASIFERWGKLDGFLGNAGVLGALTPLSHLDVKLYDELLAVNVTANWRLIRSLDPLLKRAEAGRVVFVSSSVAQKPRAFWGGYAMTKAALESLALTYAAECEATPVKVNVLNPGATATAMRAKAMPGEDPSTLPSAEAVAALAAKMLTPEWTEQGAVVKYREWVKG